MPKKSGGGDDNLDLPEWDEDEIKKMLENLNTEINLEGLIPEVDLNFLAEMHDDSTLKDLMEGFNDDSALKDLIERFNNVSDSDADEENIPTPDPSLTEQDVAQWMLEQVHDNGSLYQSHAAFYIRRYFGDRFVYSNRNFNLAISKEVLEAFFYISLPTVVWVKKGRYWRRRKPSDDPKAREVSD